ncbi:MAG: 50S ribosome-binding protein YggL [Akkermansia sp.]
MNKRLRKKYRVGEFKELGFSFSFEYKGDVDSAECEAFLNKFIDECIDANGLDCDGNLTEEGCFFLAAAADPRDTTDEQRNAVKSWLEASDEAELKECSELIDLWYDSF